MSDAGTVVLLDACGLTCPLPVLRARKRLQAMQPGQRLRLLSTDAASALDVPVFCHQAGHVLVGEERDGERYVFLIERAP